MGEKRHMEEEVEDYAFVKASRNGNMGEITRLVTSGVDVNACIETSMLNKYEI